MPRAAEAARAQTIPIVVFPVAAQARFEALGALIAALRTRKLIFLHRPGGLRQNGELLPLVNLTTDAAALAHAKELSRKERALVDESRKLVERTPHRLSVAITSPLNLFRELFTIKGAGTLLRRGAVIERRRFADLDRERLRALLTRSFGRPPVDEFFGRDIAWGYVEEGYRGAALVHETPLGAYLSKFAVDAEAQGEGIGRDLWQALGDRLRAHLLARAAGERRRRLVRQAVRRAHALPRVARLLEGAAAVGCGAGRRVGAAAAGRSGVAVNSSSCRCSLRSPGLRSSKTVRPPYSSLRATIVGDVVVERRRLGDRFHAPRFGVEPAAPRPAARRCRAGRRRPRAA